MSVVITGKNVVLPDYIGTATIYVENGIITSIKKSPPAQQEIGTRQVINAGEHVVMPGVVDSHVHVNEPGRTDWEGFETATKAAAAGGITTIVDMPLNSIPSTTTLEAFHTKMNHARGQCYVDVGFWGGVVPDNQTELRPMIKAGICGFKCFLIHSGVEEFQHVTEQDLHKALPQLQGTNSVLLFHAEVEQTSAGDSSAEEPPEKYETFLDSRPDCMEVEAIKLVCKLCLQYRCHIVHLSSAEALTVIREARAAGAPLTVETTHHYLCLDAESTPRGATQYKCCPPIRGSNNQRVLWEALLKGDIDMVISDHSPCTANLKLLKQGDFMKAWGGIASVQFGLSLFWTKGKEYGITLENVRTLLCENTAKVASLDKRKGFIREGHDADFVIWNPDGKFRVTEDKILHKNKVTPYLNQDLYGVVEKTIVRGDIVFENGRHSDTSLGQLLLI